MWDSGSRRKEGRKGAPFRHRVRRPTTCGGRGNGQTERSMDVVDAAAATEEQATSQSKPIQPNLPGIGGGCSSTSVAWTLKKGGRELTDFGSVGDSAAAPAQSDGREGKGRERVEQSRAREGGRVGQTTTIFLFVRAVGPCCFVTRSYRPK